MEKPAIIQRPIESRILFVRGVRVLLDNDLAELYGIPVKRLNEQVKRNSERFPKDFMFRLTAAEYQNLRSQIATSKQRRGGRRYLPFAFTEYGAIMAASVLNSERAVEMSLFVVRAFVRLREMLSSHRELAIKLSELERKLDTHDHAIQEIIDTIRELTELPDKPQKQIGFRAESRASLKRLQAKAGG
ncbi:MAG TPA: ORF6N domain-containing protein [Terriglobales bacterium]|nr:ORF6N domain-containing protein [Terriglobales bacterium]